MVINRQPKGVKCKDCVYVGRWGNKFKIGEHGTREEVIAQAMAGRFSCGKGCGIYEASTWCVTVHRWLADVLLMLASLPRLRNYIDRGRLYSRVVSSLSREPRPLAP